MNHISIRQKLKIGKFLEIPKPESCKKTVVEEFYIVKKGDTLIKIARKFLKDSFFRGKSKLRKFKRAIWTWNRDKIKRQSRINPGWKILLYLCK
jgi:nucleoid-associated protein YgaU